MLAAVRPVVISGDAIHADATQTHLLLLRVGLRQRLDQILHLLRLHNKVRHKPFLFAEGRLNESQQTRPSTRLTFKRVRLVVLLHIT